MSTFQMTQEMVDQGLFSGAGTLYVGGKVHALVPKPKNVHTDRYDQVSVCGMGMMRDRLFKSELPAVITCRTCEPKAESAAVAQTLFAPEPAGETAEEPEPEAAGNPGGGREERDPAMWHELYDKLFAEHEQLKEQLRVASCDRDAYKESLESGLADWRTRRGNMGGKIRTLEGKVEQLEIELAASQAKERRPAPKAAELRAQLDNTRRALGLWKGVAGVLLWQHGGAGLREKTLLLQPAVWAVAVAQVISIAMTQEDDGSVKVTATLQVPEGPPAVSL